MPGKTTAVTTTTSATSGATSGAVSAVKTRATTATTATKAAKAANTTAATMTAATAARSAALTLGLDDINRLALALTLAAADEAAENPRFAQRVRAAYDQLPPSKAPKTRSGSIGVAEETACPGRSRRR